VRDASANLSETYFTNRQDRYMVFRNAPHLCDFYARFLLAMTTVTPPIGHFLPTSAPTAATWPVLPSAATPSLTEHLKAYTTASFAAAATSVNVNTADMDTWVYPTFQLAYASLCVCVMDLWVVQRN
jgi:hypothetical protein